MIFQTHDFYKTLTITDRRFIEEGKGFYEDKISKISAIYAPKKALSVSDCIESRQAVFIVGENNIYKFYDKTNDDNFLKILSSITPLQIQRKYSSSDYIEDNNKIKKRKQM